MNSGVVWLPRMRSCIWLAFSVSGMGFECFRYGLVGADGDESAFAVGRGGGLQGAATLPPKAFRLVPIWILHDLICRSRGHSVLVVIKGGGGPCVCMYVCVRVRVRGGAGRERGRGEGSGRVRGGASVRSVALCASGMCSA